MKLRVGYTNLASPNDLSFLKVERLHQYIPSIQITSSPNFSMDLYRENLYVDTITKNEDSTEWRFSFKKGCRFSDGTKLGPEDWKSSLIRQAKHGLGIHFNVRKEVLGNLFSAADLEKRIEVANDKVILRLAEPNPDLPRLTGKIEGAILPKAMENSQQLNHRLVPSSGPYRVVDFDSQGILLAKNEFYPGFSAFKSFAEVEMIVSSAENLVEGLLNNKVDFIFPEVSLGEVSLKEIKKSQIQEYKIFGQTFFLSFYKSDQGISSSQYSEQSERHRLAVSLKSVLKTSNIEADGLLMGNGYGRIDAFGYHGRVDHGMSLKIAYPKSRQVDRIVHSLKTSFPNFEFVEIQDFARLFTEDTAGCDAFLGWSDFTAKDPYICLYNAMNEKRPLIPDHGQKFSTELTRIQGLPEEKKDTAYGSLHLEILRNAYSIPLHQEWKDYYASSKIDLRKMIGFALWTASKK